MNYVFKITAIVFLLSFSNGTGNAQGRWKELSHPTDKLLFKLSFLDSLRGWVSGFGGTMLKTTNGCRTWHTQDPGIGTDIHEVFAFNDRFVWALTFKHFVDTSTWFGTKILKTTNGGNSWTQSDYPAQGEFFNTLYFRDSLNGLMAGEFGHLVRTTNGGNDWIPVEVDSSIYDRWALINIKFSTPMIGFAMGGRIDIVGVVWKTTDGGLRWTPYGPSPEPIHDVHWVDSLHVIGITGDVDVGASMIRSRDSGISWQYIFLNIFGEPLSLSFRTPDQAWVPLGFAAQMMYTRDTATTWTVVETPSRRAIYDLVFTDSLTGYAVGDSGTVLKYDPVTVDVAENPSSSPAAYALHQNFPNPFNPSTTIAFNLPRGSFVSLRVFNILGQEVRTLLDREKEAGYHLVGFDAGSLPSGVYFYRLRAGEHTSVKKMVLLR